MDAYIAAIMQPLLQQYLATQGSLPLGDLGMLRLERQPARFDAALQVVHPPRQRIAWYKEVSQVNPQHLMAFLAREQDCTEEEAYEQFAAYCRDLAAAMQQHGQVEWPGWGQLVRLNQSESAFVPASAPDRYLSPVRAVRVVHEGRAHNMVVGDTETNTAEMSNLLQEASAELPVVDRWWLPPAILAGIAVILVLIKLLGWV